MSYPSRVSDKLCCTWLQGILDLWVCTNMSTTSGLDFQLNMNMAGKWWVKKLFFLISTVTNEWHNCQLNTGQKWKYSFNQQFSTTITNHIVNFNIIHFMCLRVGFSYNMIISVNHTASLLSHYNPNAVQIVSISIICCWDDGMIFCWGNGMQEKIYTVHCIDETDAKACLMSVQTVLWF